MAPRRRRGRRGNHEGSIVQRTDGRWQARVFVGIENGRRRMKYFMGRTREDVTDALNRALGKVAAGDAASVTTDERLTTRSFLERWLRDVAAARVRPRTLDGYRQTMETHIFPHVGHVRLTQLTPQCLQAWLTVLKTRGVSTGRQRYSRVGAARGIVDGGGSCCRATRPP